MAELAALVGSAAASIGAADVSALSALSTIATVGSTVATGVAASGAAKSEAKMHERQAAVERADASRRAEEERRKTALVLSRQTALASASGAGTTNPTIMDIMEETAARGDFNARTEMYGGEDRARGQLDQASAARAKGRAAMTGSFFDAFDKGVGGYADFKKLKLQGY